MLDGLLGRGFAAKCKSLIKLTRNRIDVVRRRRKATEKFLKKDIADLLANGLDVNAYGRADGLISELTLSSCYDFVEQSCEFVLKHLSVLQKVSGCPEECREAISSLMFAAARFSDLPELRDLRQIFQERYGSSLECYVNHEFAANMNSKSSTLEKKVHLMQDIASEFSIKWDSKAFELRMSKPSASAQGHNAYKFNHSIDDNKSLQGKNATSKGVKYEALPEKSPDYSGDGHRFQNGKEAVVSKRDENHLHPKSKVPENGLKPPSSYDEVNLKRVSHGNPLPGREELTHKKSDKGYWMEGSMPKSKLPENGLKPPSSYNEVDLKRASHGNPLPGREELAHKNSDKGYWMEGSMSKSRVPESGFKPPSSYDEVNLKRVNHANPLPGREELTHKKSEKDYWKEGTMPKPIGRSSQDERVKEFEGGSNLRDSLGNATRVRESQDTATARKSPSHAGFISKNSVNEPLAFNHAGLPDDKSDRKVQKDETPRGKPCYSNALPPPYLKPNPKLKNSTRGTDLMSSHNDSDGIAKYPSIHQKPDAASKPDRIQSGLDNSEQDLQATGHARLAKEGHEKELSNQEDAKEVPVSKPKSVRRKHSKSRSIHSDAGNEEGEVVRKSRSRRRDEPRRGLQILFDDDRNKTDEEERIIDRLLIHYSKKPTASAPEKARRKSSRHAHKRNGRGDEPDETPEQVSQTPRSVSLPHEQSGAVEVNKVFVRAASFQPDRSNEARHVHPNLPDCDDLAARIAALRGS